MSCDFAYLGLAEAAELIRDKKLSPVEYATALLARIERHDLKLNAFIALMPERALAAARAAEAEIMAGKAAFCARRRIAMCSMGRCRLSRSRRVCTIR